MANCVLCEKKYGLLDSITREIPNDNRGVCVNCHRIIVDKINTRFEGISSIQSFEDEVDTIISELSLQYSSEAIHYLKDYLKYKEDLLYKEISKSEEEQLQSNADSVLASKINDHILTSGYNFEGYIIKRYIGIISGETVLGTGFLSELFASTSDITGQESDVFSKKMRIAKQSSLNKLTRQSIALGGNAIIGVDLDYINFSNNMIGVSASGTSVIIEKIVIDK